MVARLFAYLSYPDAPAALEWLKALGFEVVREQDGPAGEVLHAEVRLGTAPLSRSTRTSPPTSPTTTGRCWTAPTPPRAVG